MINCKTLAVWKILELGLKNITVIFNQTDEKSLYGFSELRFYLLN